MNGFTVTCYIIGIIIFLAIWSAIENRIFSVSSYQVQDEKIPKEFDGARILYLVDFHDVCYGDDNRRLKKIIEKLQPDYVLVGGDFVCKWRTDFKNATDILTFLATRYPVYFVNGNHETRWRNHAPQIDYLYALFETMLKEFHIKHICNGSALLTRKLSHIRIYGLELDDSYYKLGREKPLADKEMYQALGKCSSNEYSILLAHTPNYFESYARWGADLTLAGHNHGGIARIPGVGGVLSTQAHLFPAYTKGLYEKDSHKMIVSAGLGGHTIKLRFLNPSEMVMITLKCDRES